LDYLVYIVAVLIIGVLCIVAIHLYSRNSDSPPSADQKRRAMRAPKFALGSRKRGQQRAAARPTIPTPIAAELQHTPIPWGWANHKAFNRSGEVSAGLSSAMRSLSDRLVREKTLVSNGHPNPRAAESLRALLEDRYAPINKDRMTEIEFTKVKRPLLRDPSEPHDQMDNFGIRNAERISKKLRRVVAPEAQGKTRTKPDDDFRYVPIKNVKLPWGW